MTQDETLQVLLKLSDGNKEKCLQRIQVVRDSFPGKSMQWCIEKAIYDIRFGKKAVKANPKLSRWTESGGQFPSLSTPGAKPQSTSNAMKPDPISPQSGPRPNPAFSTPQPNTEEVSVSLPDLAALAKAKRKQCLSQPASPIVKNRLDYLTKDHRVSDRLVKRIQLANPDRSEQWAYEKAVYDLERDRI